MIKIGFLNHKGGVGKTLLSAHLIWMLDKKGYKVLGVDCDTQKHLMKLVSGYTFAKGEEFVSGNIRIVYGSGKNLSSLYESSAEDFSVLDGRPTLEVLPEMIKDLDLILVPINGRLSVESVSDIRKMCDCAGSSANLIVIRNQIMDVRPALRKREEWLLAGLGIDIFQEGLIDSDVMRSAEMYGRPVWRLSGYGPAVSNVKPFFDGLVNWVIKKYG
jgi:cellulose biosynthesis protein BcsQ